MELLTVFLFALAVSADGFMVGVSYGIGKIRIPVYSLLVISLASALAVTLSMLVGKGLTTVFTPALSASVGAIIIILAGVYLLLSAGRKYLGDLKIDDSEPLISFSIKSLGIIVQILKEPSRADLDSSGEISSREAFFLGLALALDALGAGVGMAMAGFQIIYTAVAVGVLKFVLVNSGLHIGGRLFKAGIHGFASIIPGVILITIGVLELL